MESGAAIPGADADGQCSTVACADLKNSIAALQKWFRGSIEPVPVSLFYRLSAIVVAGLMVLLPLLYLAIIAAVIGGVIAWLIYMPGVMLDEFRGGMILRAFAYIAIPIIGGVVVTFMITPLFRRRAREISPFNIEPSQEPLLFAFVEQIAGAINAPTPYRIEVTPHANASASFHNGMFGMVSGRLTLQIGMPLVIGLPISQLAGVIAHELGHFSQHSAMRMTYIVRSINYWFARLVYERDRFDQWLIERSHGESWAALIFLSARPCVALVRLLLWMFMIVSDAICCILLRQMEFNADQYEVRMSGSDAFVQTMERLPQLAAAEFYIMHQLHEAAAEKRLAVNLPAVIVELSQHLDGVVQQAEQSRWTRFFATHPDDESRIRNATCTTSHGLLQVDQPASTLFQRCELLCKWVTAGAYESVLGAIPPEDALVPVERIVQRDQLERRGGKAVETYYQNLLQPNMPLFPSATWLRMQVNPARAVETINSARKRLHRERTAIETLLAELDKTTQRQLDIVVARALLSAGVPIKARKFGLARGDLAAAREAAEQSRAKLNGVKEKLLPYHELIRARLSHALALINCDAVATHLSDPPRLARHAHRCIASLAALDDAHDVVDQLRLVYTRMGALYLGLQEASATEQLSGAAQAAEREGHQLLMRLQQMLSQAAYPFQSELQNLSIGQFLTASSGGEPPSLPERICDAGSRFDQLYFRLMGRLALIGLHIESAIRRVDETQLPTVSVQHHSGSDDPAIERSADMPTEADAAIYRLEE